MSMSAKSTPEYLISNAEQYPNENAISWKDDSGNWINMNWAEFCNTSMSVAKSLLAMGFESGSECLRSEVRKGPRLGLHLARSLDFFLGASRSIDRQALAWRKLYVGQHVGVYRLHFGHSCGGAGRCVGQQVCGVGRGCGVAWLQYSRYISTFE